jgi:hypothetical protein
MSGPIDLAARRTARTRDAYSVIADFIAGSESLHAAAASLPLSPLSEARIIGLERHLVALSVLVADLRRRVVPAPGAA